MISDINMKCPKCGGTLERKSTILHSSSAKEYECQCARCGDKTILIYESTNREIDEMKE